MSKAFGWAFIGAGKLGTQVAKQITASGRHRIVSVYVRNAENRAAFADKHGALAAATPEEAMTAEGVDGVYIVTPHTSHFEYAKQALELGKPVLCEKPVSTDAQKVAELIRLSEEKGVYFTEGMWTWFSPIANQIKAWFDAGEYGELAKFRMLYHLKSINYAPRVSDPKLGGGAILDIGIYPVTYAYRLLGKPERIECSGTIARGIDTDEEIRLYYPGGVVCEISNSILDMKGLERLTIEGTKASTDLMFYHSANSVKLKRRGEKDVSFTGSGGFVNEFDLVAAEIGEGLTESRFVPHEATLGVMEILDECRRQMNLIYPFEMETDTEKNYIRTISHLGFNCSDIEKSIAFYRDIMGCREKFTLTWDDLAQDIRKKHEESGEKLPFYVKEMEKRLAGKKWSVYMNWTDNTFIELFYVPSAKRKHPADPKNDLNYTHFSLEVSDLKAFREQVLARGGAPYIDSEIEMGLENTWVFWMHDPDGNRFEIMEYTPESYQVVGR
ncbi:MAG: Gfo/Idh/MocA family oxidoreductase [Lachnospiraceae bacterium]|nr:Gfo/Idh/MocA family oxidoreductase [Lachnospiraceae bacterium]